MNTQTLFYGTILLTAILGVVLGAVALSFRELIKKYYSLKEEYERQVTESQSSKELMTQEAKKMADQIVASAQAKALAIVNEVSTFSTKSKEEFNLEIKKATQAQMANFESALEEVKNEASATFGNISKEVRNEVVGQIDLLKKAIHDEIESSQAKAKAAIDEGYKKVEVQILEYRDLRVKQIDERIMEMVSEIVLKATGKALNFDEHEDLVISALEEAKKENVL